jgi:hypothetical protein
MLQNKAGNTTQISLRLKSPARYMAENAEKYWCRDGEDGAAVTVLLKKEVIRK